MDFSQAVGKWLYLVVVVWRQQCVDSSHRLKADLLVCSQIKAASWQIRQVLKVYYMLCFCPSAVHTLLLKLALFPVSAMLLQSS